MKLARCTTLAVALVIALTNVAVAQGEPTDRPSSPVDGEMARVVEVVDGDTIKVDRGHGVETVRYVGIDTPETVYPDEPVQPFGPESSEANERLVAGKSVILERDVSETDRYDRLLRYVWVDTDDGLLMVNDELLAQGLADVTIYPPDERYADLFYATRDAAAAEGLGMWGSVAAATPTLTPEPTKPTLSDLPLNDWDSRVAYRWLETGEYACSNPWGCVGLLVRASDTCSNGLKFAVAMLDEDGDRLETLAESRATLKKGGQVSYLFEVPTGASNARLVRLECKVKAKAKPKPAPKPKPKPKPKARGDCDPSYPTVCIRPYPPDLDCGQIPFRRFKVRGPDRHGFDGDNDGIGCES